MKIHISPKIITFMVQNARTSDDIQVVHDLVKESAHTYLLRWILEEKIKKIREEQQESATDLSNQTSKQSKDHWEEYLKGDFNGAIKIRQETKK